MEIHVTRDGQQFGPLTPEMAQQYLDAGQLLPTDMAWHEGLPGWTPLGELLGSAGDVVPSPSILVDGAVSSKATEASSGKKTLVLAVRICLGVFLFLALLIAGFDRFAAYRWNAAPEEVNEILESGSIVQPMQLNDRLGKEPVSNDSRGSAMVLSYDWGGSIRVYRLEVICSTDGSGHLWPVRSLSPVFDGVMHGKVWMGNNGAFVACPLGGGLSTSTCPPL